MCGIAGIYGRRGRTADRRLLLEMAGELRHRGPDGVGLYLDGRFGMVQQPARDRRPRGRRPAAVRRARPLLGDAERRDLQLRRAARASSSSSAIAFATTSDTEVIAHAYEEWGVGCLDRLNGDFAIAVWDRADGETLFLARDRFGVRPLFLAEYGGDVCFASEAQGAAAPSVRAARARPGRDRRHLHRLDDAPGSLRVRRASASCRRRTTVVIGPDGRRSGDALVGHRLLAGRGRRGRA